MVRALAVDVGSSSIRTAIVDERGVVSHVHQAHLNVRTPHPGEMEFDPTDLIGLSLKLAHRTLDDAGGCDVVGITNQRGSAIVFDPLSGEAVGPALSWQDLRTVLDCLVLQGDGLRLAPNQSATKFKWLLDQSGRRAQDLRAATIETWLAWHLSEGDAFVTDRSNASISGLLDATFDAWDQKTLSQLGLDPLMLPELVDTMGTLGPARALRGTPPITALVGDQPASLFGQNCVTRGVKITFGTGAILDMVHGPSAPASNSRFASGCYPTVVRSRLGVATWGVEGIVLSAGSCVAWLADLGLLAQANDSEALARSVTSSDGVSFVPAFNGLGTPRWDFGARGAFFGLTRGSSRAHLVRAVLEGVAQRGGDLLDAAAQESDTPMSEVRVDGGMSANRFFVQRLADFSGCRVAVSWEREATTRGAGLMALVGSGHLSLEDAEALWAPAFVATPSLSEDERLARRTRWREVVTRVERTIPELSAVSF